MEDKPFASPGPAAFTVLFFVLVGLWLLNTGLAPHEMEGALIPVAIAGAIVQFTAGVIELKNGSLAVGNLLFAFCAFMFIAAFSGIFKATGVIAPHTEFVDGWVYLAMTLILIGYTPIIFMMNAVMSLFILLADIFFLLFSIGQIILNHQMLFLSGWILVPMAIFLFYQIIGEVINHSFGRAILPLGKGFIGPKK